MELEDEFIMEMLQKHNKDLIAAIKGIKLPPNKDNSDLIKRVESAVLELADKIKNQQPPKVVVEKTEINQKEVVSLLKDLIKEIKALNKEEKKEEKSLTFDVVRNQMGFIQSVIVRKN